MTAKVFSQALDFDKDPVTFKLDGFRTSEPHEAWEEEFTLLPAIPHAALTSLMSIRGVDTRGRPVWNAPAIEDFLMRAMTEESGDRFHILSLDPDRVVTVSVLAEIVSWMMDEFLDRPTKRSSASSRGATAIASTSEAESHSGAVVIPI